jgi:hypothetical protein
MPIPCLSRFVEDRWRGSVGDRGVNGKLSSSFRAFRITVLSTLARPSRRPAGARRPLQDISARMENRGLPASDGKPRDSHRGHGSASRRPQPPGLSPAAEPLIAQFHHIHSSVCGPSREPEDDDLEVRLDGEFRAIKESFRQARFHRVNPEDLDELWLRRTQEAKLEGRETARAVGLSSRIGPNPPAS